MEAFSWTADFELFRPELEKTLSYSDGSKDEYPPFDPAMMFSTEYPINDRPSFMRFLGLGL